MSVPTVLRSTDSGAPDLTGEDGSLYDVLKWALPQLGWTLEHDDATNFRAAFRNDPTTGTGYYFRLVDKAADHNADARRARVTGYSSMSDVDTGVDPIEPSGGQCFIVKSTTLDATARAYMVFGTETGFYLLVDSFSDRKSKLFFIGDFRSLDSSDNKNFIVCASANTSTSMTQNIMPWRVNDDGQSIGAWAFDHQGTSPQSTHHICVHSVFSGDDNSMIAFSGFDGVYPEPVTGGVMTAELWLKQDSGNALRGRLPGILAICNNIDSAVDWASVYSPTEFQTIEDQAMPHGVGTMSYQYIDHNWDWSYYSNQSIWGWDLDADWGAW